ncbi:hypothetical protein FB593_11727 [Rhizobium sp. SJZ105]|nr:hypothetical protein FB593_11727 [Rhizobium sp. SJZ105]
MLILSIKSGHKLSAPIRASRERIATNFMACSAHAFFNSEITVRAT